MIPKLRATIKEAVARWVETVIAWPWLVMAAGIILTIFCGFYSARHLGVITDTAVMLSKDLGYLKVYRHFKREFPHSYNQIVILVEGVTPDLSMDGRDRLASALRKRRDLFPWVYLPGDDTFFKKNGLLFLSVDRLEELSDNLAKAQPILSRLVEKTDLAGFFSILSQALIQMRKGREINLESVFSELDRTFNAIEKDRFYQMSWVRLMSGKSVSGSSMQLIIVQPKVDYESILPGRRAIKVIRQVTRKLGLVPEKGVTVMLTGDIPMQYDELRSVTKGAKLAGMLSFVMVGFVLVSGLGSMRLVLATLVCLVMGLVFTAAFGAWAIGHLNMISVAFAVLFIGLGVDYAIHYCLRYRELLLCGYGSREALLRSCRDVGPSLVLCAVTTSIGFYSFMPTDFSGVAELGLISGTGMFIALFCNFTFLPAMISLFPLQAASRQPYYITSDCNPIFIKVMAWPYSKAGVIRAAAICLTIFSVFLVPKVRFDSNPINLRDPNAESIRAFKKLLRDPNTSPWSLESLSPNRAEADRRKDLFDRLKSVRHAIDLSSFIPADQEEKLDIIADMEMMLGPVLEGRVVLRRERWDRELPALRRFGTELAGSISLFRKDSRALASGLLEKVRTFLKKVDVFDEQMKEREIERLNQAVLGSFPARIKEFRIALSAGPLSLGNLPTNLKSEWVGRDGCWRIEVVPAKNPRNDREIMDFISEARRIDKDVTGYPVLIIEGGRAVVRAFKQAFAYSLVSIFVLLLILMPRRKDALLVLYSLFLAGVLSAAFMVVIGMPLNFANIIALPLVLGIGVDNGIHIVHRHRQALEEPASLLRTSTARSIFFSTMTTICSFGNLAVSPHVGMASMGKLLSIGILMTLLTSMIVLPAFLARRKGPVLGVGR